MIRRHLSSRNNVVKDPNSSSFTSRSSSACSTTGTRYTSGSLNSRSSSSITGTSYTSGSLNSRSSSSTTGTSYTSGSINSRSSSSTTGTSYTSGSLNSRSSSSTTGTSYTSGSINSRSSSSTMMSSSASWTATSRSSSFNDNMPGNSSNSIFPYSTAGSRISGFHQTTTGIVNFFWCIFWNINCQDFCEQLQNLTQFASFVKSVYSFFPKIWRIREEK